MGQNELQNNVWGGNIIKINHDMGKNAMSRNGNFLSASGNTRTDH